jgi:hypothetical protein
MKKEAAIKEKRSSSLTKELLIPTSLVPFTAIQSN